VDGKPGPAPSSRAVTSVAAPNPMRPGQPPSAGLAGGKGPPRHSGSRRWPPPSRHPVPVNPGRGRFVRPTPTATEFGQGRHTTCSKTPQRHRLPGARPGRHPPDSSGRSTPSRPRTEAVSTRAAARPQGQATEGRGSQCRAPLRRNAPRDRGSHALRRRRSGGHRKGCTARKPRLPSTATCPASRSVAPSEDGARPDGSRFGGQPSGWASGRVGSAPADQPGRDNPRSPASRPAPPAGDAGTDAGGTGRGTHVSRSGCWTWRSGRPGGAPSGALARRQLPREWYRRVGSMGSGASVRSPEEGSQARVRGSVPGPGLPGQVRPGRKRRNPGSNPSQRSQCLGTDDAAADGYRDTSRKPWKGTEAHGSIGRLAGGNVSRAQRTRQWSKALRSGTPPKRPQRPCPSGRDPRKAAATA
jgi:hypothetical protein